jgi:hypothetical protein
MPTETEVFLVVFDVKKSSIRMIFQYFNLFPAKVWTEKKKGLSCSGKHM